MEIDIKALESAIADAINHPSELLGVCLTVKEAQAVLSLLKEQEAVEPILIREGLNKHYNDYVCPRCDNEVVYEQNYCSECGARFLWEREVK